MIANPFGDGLSRGQKNCSSLSFHGFLQCSLPITLWGRVWATAQYDIINCSIQTDLFLLMKKMVKSSNLVFSLTAKLNWEISLMWHSKLKNWFSVITCSVWERVYRECILSPLRIQKDKHCSNWMLHLYKHWKLPRWCYNFLWDGITGQVKHETTLTLTNCYIL